MAIKAAVVAKDEFVEIRVDVLAAQAMVCAKSPSLEQRESPVSGGVDPALFGGGARAA
jgi:hypothetical protein